MSSLLPASCLWGKSHGLATPYPLICHLIDSAAAARALTEQLPAGTIGFLAESLRIPPIALPGVVSYLTGLHDLGKATPGFQRLDARAAAAVTASTGLEIPVVAYVRHERVTQLAVWDSCCEWSAGNAQSPRAVAAQLLSGHHGRYHDPIPRRHRPGGDPALGNAAWTAMRTDLLERVRNLHPNLPAILVLPLPAAHLLCALCIVADWLVSSEDYLAKRVPTAAAEDAERHHAGSLEAGRAAVVDAGLVPATLRPQSFAASFTFVPRGIQQAVLDRLTSAPGVAGDAELLVIAAPTGEGKTAAALAAAERLGRSHGRSGVVVALPTMATADEMLRRVAAWLGRSSTDPVELALVHSMAGFHPHYSTIDADRHVGGDGTTVRAANQWLRGAKRGLLAPAAVVTIDQVLATVLRSPHNALRMLGLVNKVVVIDEAHDVDPYMQALLCRALTWLATARVPVVLCSATLPTTAREALIGAYHQGAAGLAQPTMPVDVANFYPGWTHYRHQAGHGSIDAAPASVSPHNERTLRTHRHVYHPGGGASTDAAVAVVDELIGGRDGCILVLRNTVGDAQSTFLELRHRHPDLELHLLHARYRLRDRRERTTRLIARFGKTTADRPARAVVVATQVAEQSLDVDFDAVVTDLAPITSLLQRAGRCWRHPGTPRPTTIVAPQLHVLIPVDGDGEVAPTLSTRMIYPLSHLLRTAHLLGTHPTINVPGDVQRLVDTVYPADWGNDAALIEPDLEYRAKSSAQAGLAAVVSMPAPANLLGLHELTADVSDRALATRLGADSERVLFCWDDGTGALWLNPECSIPVPLHPQGLRFGAVEIRHVMDHTVAVPVRDWVRALREASDAHPVDWGQTPWLQDVLLSPLRQGSGTGPSTGDVDYNLELGVVTS